MSDVEQSGIGIGTQGMLAWSRGYKYAPSKDLPYNQLFHVAGVFVPNDHVRFYVNGKQQSKSEKTGSFKPSPYTLLIGGNPNSRHSVINCLTGKIASVRISNFARYDNVFIPEKQFSADANTLALYLMDEGQGTQIQDSSGNGHHGKIYGATWTTIETPKMIQ